LPWKAVLTETVRVLIPKLDEEAISWRKKTAATM
jgi:hypothetical protein